MDDYSHFQDDILQELQDMEDRQRSATFQQFVEDAGRFGLTVDDLIAMHKGSGDGKEFLRRVKAELTRRGVVVTGLED